MKHETTETVTFTKVSYSCDLCKKDLLAGAQPFICGICGRETCNNFMCSEWKSMTHDDIRICAICRSLEHFSQHIADALNVYEQKEKSILQQWKEESLNR